MLKDGHLPVKSGIGVLMRIIGLICCAFLIALLMSPQDVDPRDRDYWNRKFSDSNTPFNREPSQLLIEAIRDRRPGVAVDLGMGEGRNAIYLAQQGWQTTGVDLSDVAVTQAKRRALQIGVRLDTVIDDLDHFDLGRNRWDLIALFYAVRSRVARSASTRHSIPVACW